MASSWTHDGFRTAEVARLAGLDAERIRQMVRDGYCQVARVGRYLHFTFAEVVLFRNNRAQVLNQFACSDHFRLFACRYPPIVPLTRPR